VRQRGANGRALAAVFLADEDDPVPPLPLGEDPVGAVGGAVVDHDDLLLEVELGDAPQELVDGRGLVVDGDDEGDAHGGGRDDSDGPRRYDPALMAADVCFVVGARPNFVKAAPVLRALRERTPERELLLVHTGQHYDEDMSVVFLRELGLPTPDVYLGVGSGSHAEQTARALVGVEGVLLEHRPELVVVAGDVNSTLAGALAAAKLEIPVAHIESGLRSFDPTMPEEHNRKLTDHLSSVLLAHSQSALDNLAAEGIPGDRVHLVGNTMIDSLLEHVDAARAREPWRELGVSPGEFGLVTLHRPALVDDPDLLRVTLDGLSELARSVPLVFPVHPRTRARIDDFVAQSHKVPDLLLTPPLGYLDFLGLEAEARFVLTDSGGVQEETTFLGVPCFTLRDTTERPVTVRLGTNTVLGLAPERIAAIPAALGGAAPPRRELPPLWDGRAAKRIGDVITGAGQPQSSEETAVARGR
jgi:UDP-N-acetylglucosamine 2-epimerase (non-hydrolysing)